MTGKKISKLIILIHVIAPALCLGQVTNITVGNSPNNEDGDSPRSAYLKINANEQYLGALANTNGALSPAQLQNSLKSGTNTFTGAFVETNSDANPLTIGKSTPNSIFTFGASGNEFLGWRFPPGGVFFDGSAGIVSWALWGVSGKSDLEFQDSAITTQRGGAPMALYGDYVGGKGSSLTGIMPNGREIWVAKSHPWLGVYTSIIGEGDTPSTFVLSQKAYTNLIAVAKSFNTSGINAQLQRYGIQTGIWGDQGWSTNRTAAGSLRFDPNILSAIGVSNESNYVAAIHTNGVKLSLHIYYTSRTKNYLNGDTERVFQNNADVSYPSGLTGGNPYWSEITPETIAKDIGWFYSNRIDEIFRADIGDFTEQQGYEQQLGSFDYSIMYPPSQQPGIDVYWRNLTNWGLITPFPDAQGTISNQLILGAFVNRPSYQTAYQVNDVSPDQAYPLIGSDLALAAAMQYGRTYNDYMSNWPCASAMPIFSSMNADNNDSTLTASQWTNFYSVSEMFHANTFVDIDTNTWAWNTSQTAVVTNNPLFLSTWQDNLLAWPVRLFDDGTNSCWMRPVDNGAYLLLAANQSGSSSNYLVSLPGVGYPPAPVFPTNYLWNVTNVFGLSALSGGVMTNTIAFTVPAASCIYARISPARVAVTNAGVVYFASPVQTQ